MKMLLAYLGEYFVGRLASRTATAQDLTKNPWDPARAVTQRRWRPTGSAVLALANFAFCIFALGNAANAEMKPLQNTPSNVEIIGGKRFYSLNNARRFNGGTNNPKALSVMHHPHSSAPLIIRPGLSASSGAKTATPATNLPDTPGSPKTQSDQVLSIFTPDEKNMLSPPPTK